MPVLKHSKLIVVLVATAMCVAACDGSVTIRTNRSKIDSFGKKLDTAIPRIVDTAKQRVNRMTERLHDRINGVDSARK